MGHAAGKKIGKRHTTIIDAAAPVIKQARRMEEVDKVVLGTIKTGVRPGKIRLKCVDLPAGLKVTIRGNTAVQTVYLYTRQKRKVQKALSKIYSS